MKTAVAFYAASLFSGGQIAGMVILAVMLAVFIGCDIYVAYALSKRAQHRMSTAQLQSQRDALMRKLTDMRAGRHVMTEEERRSAQSVVNVFDPRFAAAAPAADEDDVEPEEDVDETLDDETEAEVEVTEPGVVVRYNRSFTARLTQADNDLKARYSELKNYLLVYNGVKARMSWRHETFVMGRKPVVRCFVRGKTLCICLAIDPKVFAETKRYKIDDMSGQNSYKSMPCMYRITSDRKMGYAKELVDIALAGFNAERKAEFVPEDYTLPYKSTEVLIKRRLIKVVGGEMPEFDRASAVAAKKGMGYNRSFEARIIQSSDSLKNRYSKLKNYLLAHVGVSAADSWKRETFKYNKSNVAAFVVRGKTLCLLLDADPASFEGTKFVVEDLRLRSKSADLAVQYRIKSARKLAYAMQLIDKVFAEKGIAKAEIEYVNYAVPFVATENLIRRGLIRVTTDSGFDPDKFKTDVAEQPADIAGGERPPVAPAETAEDLDEVAATENTAAASAETVDTPPPTQKKNK